MKTVQKMASGHLYVTLVENINLDDFPVLAKEWSARLGADVIRKAYNFDVQIWNIKLSRELFYLAGDIWQNALTLESTSDAGDKIIQDLKV